MKKLPSIIFIIMLTLLLGACSRNEEDSQKNAVNIYYIDTKTSSLVSEKYTLISTDVNERIDELLYMIKLSPENIIYKSVLPENVPEPGFTLNEDGSLVLDFDSSYIDLKGIPEILCRAAFVETLSQLEEVEYVQINVNGSPMIEANGDVVGPLTVEDFIDNTETVRNKIKLYFANSDGDALIEYDSYIYDTSNSSLEELAIEQLINGPTQLGLQRTIPEGTVLLNVTTSDGICTVDFNEKFLDKLPDVDEEVTIYSVVNTLIELPDINKVQFTINNQVVQTFWEDLRFDVLFARNLDLIESTK